MKTESICFTAAIESHNLKGEKQRTEYSKMIKRHDLIMLCEKLGISIGWTMPYALKSERGFPIDLKANASENSYAIYNACFISLGEFKYEPILYISKTVFENNKG